MKIKHLLLGLLGYLAACAQPVMAQGIIVGVAPAVNQGASTLVVAAHKGNLVDATVATTTAGWLMVFNSTTAPTNGTKTPGVASGNYEDCVSAPAAGTYTISYPVGAYEYFNTGITLAFSSTACPILTLATVTALHGRAQ